MLLATRAGCRGAKGKGLKWTGHAPNLPFPTYAVATLILTVTYFFLCISAPFLPIFPSAFILRPQQKKVKDMTDMERRQYHLSLRMHRHMVMGIEVPSDTDASSPNEDW
jgi:hypothetical protein